MTEIEFKNIFRKHELASRNKGRICFLNECEEKAISSHLLQKNGILNRIATNSHLYQFIRNPYYTEPFFFEKIGINKAFAFPGFCDLHDTKIFKEIETSRLDFTNYRTNLLFSYRILANEIRKKEILIDQFIMHLNELNQYLDNLQLAYLDQTILGYKQSLKDGEYFLSKFYSDLQTSTKNFCFKIIELPYIEICASGVYTYETTKEINEIPDSLCNEPLTDIYFNLLPIENHSIAIFGCLIEMKEKCWDHISSFCIQDNKKALKKISDLLLTNIENWLCSESVFRQLENCQSEINFIYQESVCSTDERRALSFNLFDYIKIIN